MKKLLLALLLISTPAFGQWGTATNNVPVGRGPGVVGQANSGQIICAVAPAGTTLDPTGSADSFTGLQNCITNNRNVKIATGTYRITAAIIIPNNTTIEFSENVTIRQSTANTATLYAGTTKSNIFIKGNGAMLQGRGIYCGNPGQGVTADCPTGQFVGNINDVGIYFDACTNCGVTDIHTRDYGGGGIFITNSNHIVVQNLYAEGTNAYTTPIVADANYQAGISIQGTFNNIQIISPEITGTAQGILIPDGTSDRSINISNANFHDIPGQHGIYASTGGTTISGVKCYNVSFACIKLQVQTASQDTYGFSATGVVATSIGGNMFEIGIVSGGTNATLRNIYLQGVGNVVDRGLSLGTIATSVLRDVTANIVVSEPTEGIVIQGAGGLTNISIDAQISRAEREGILYTHTNTPTNIKIRPTINRANTSNAGHSGISIASASGGVVDLTDPIIYDPGALMVNAINNSISGTTLRINGSITTSGSSGVAINATGSVLLPLNRNISGGGGSHSGAGFVIPEVGSTSVPYSHIHIANGSNLNWGAGDVTIGANANILAFQSASNGYRFDNTILNFSNAQAALGTPSIGFSALYLGGSVSGTAGIVPQATAGTPTITIPTASGTIAVSAAAPLSLNTTTGALSCASCSVLTSGTSGGVPYYNSSTTIASSGMLALNTLLIGGGTGGAPSHIGTLGTTTTVLHGNAAGAPSFAQVNLTNTVTGTLPVGNGGTGLTSGTSGGVLYFSAANTIASSSALTLNNIVLGGGAGGALGTVGSLGTTSQVLIGNAAGAPSWGSVNLASMVTGDLPYSNLTQGSALSVLGVTGNATADVASIVAGSDGNVLRRSGTSVAFGAISLASSNAVTGTLPVANGGTNYTGGAFGTTSPTVTARGVAGTFAATATLSTLTIGKFVHVSGFVQVTNAGSGGVTGMTFTLPTAPRSTGLGRGIHFATVNPTDGVRYFMGLGGSAGQMFYANSTGTEEAPPVGTYPFWVTYEAN